MMRVAATVALSTALVSAHGPQCGAQCAANAHADVGEKLMTETYTSTTAPAPTMDEEAELDAMDDPDVGPFDGVAPEIIEELDAIFAKLGATMNAPPDALNWREISMRENITPEQLLAEAKEVLSDPSMLMGGVEEEEVAGVQDIDDSAKALDAMDDDDDASTTASTTDEVPSPRADLPEEVAAEGKVEL